MLGVKDRKKILFTEGPFFKKILFFVIPVLLSSLLQKLYHTADIAVVGWFGQESSIAAIGSTGNLGTLCTGLFIGLSLGAGVVAAQQLGAGNTDKVSKVIHNAVLLALTLGVVIAGAAILLSRQMLIWTGVPSDIIDQANVYLVIIFTGTPGSLLYNYCASVLRSMGDSRRPLIFLTISGITNVVLNAVFVVAFGWGVAGVALATTISTYLSAVMCVTYMIRDKGIIHISVKKLRFHGETLKQMLVIGIPSGIQTTLFALSNVVIQSSINAFGDLAIAGSTAGDTLGTFVYFTGNSLYQANVTVVGQNYGAGRLDNIKKSTKLCLLMSTVGMLTMSLIILLFRSFFVTLIVGHNAAIAEYAYQRMYIELPFYFICGWMEVMSGVLRGIGKSTTSAVISLIGACGFRILWVNVIFFFVERNVGWIHVSKVISWALVLIVQVILVSHFLRKLKSVFDKNKTEAVLQK